jgi:hypothetical protein
MSAVLGIISIHPTKGKLMDEFDFDLDCSVVYDRDLAQDWAMSRMADAEMGDL